MRASSTMPNLAITLHIAAHCGQNGHQQVAQGQPQASQPTLEPRAAPQQSHAILLEHHPNAALLQPTTAGHSRVLCTTRIITATRATSPRFQT